MRANVTDIYCLFAFQWVPRKGDENYLMTRHMSMWINPDPQLQPMEMLIEMLLT